MSDFKKFTDGFITEVANVATFIGDKTVKLVDQTKIKIAISHQETIIDNLYKKIGKYYFEKAKQGLIDEDLMEDYKIIETAQKTIEALKKETKADTE